MTSALAVVSAAFALLVASPTSAAVFAVDTTADAPDAAIDGTCASAAGQCTLRAAVQEANANAESDVINVPAGKYTLKLVGASEDAAATGDLDLTGEIDIIGAGTKATVIKGKKDRVFDIRPGAAVAISHLTVANGQAGAKGVYSDAASGGGILSAAATLELQDVVLAKNATSASGGGIACYSGSTLQLTEVRVTGNKAGDDGGGISCVGSNLTLTDVLVAGNKAGDDAGGIDLDGTDTVLTNVTVAKNKSKDDSGGMEVEGAGHTVALTNCTFSGNGGREKGGGIGCEQYGALSLTNVTLKGNKVKYGGGGIGNDGTCSITLHNTLFDTNKPSGCAGPMSLDGGNIESGASCGLDGASQNLKLKLAGLDLKKNGGATPTHALKAGSPAIDHGVDPCPATDQRGAARINACDSGAFEFVPPDI